MEQLCQKINMPQEATAAILRWHNDPDFTPDLHALTCESTWASGRKALLESLGDDPDGFKELCCMLRCTLEAKAEFDRLGIPEEIYYDTMSCFSRYVRENLVSYGSYSFDRGFWTVRHISCKLFRIGQLEYELTTLDGVPAISIHIPTDVKLHMPLLRDSCLEARKLIARVFPDYADAFLFCHSWLLSPTLQELLPPDSNILKFQQSFQTTILPDPADGYLLWVFKNPNLPPEQYPENTSLQRRLKAHLLGGGTVANARGILIDEPFL